MDRRLARDLAAYGGGRVLAGGSLFEDVVKGICGTNTTWTPGGRRPSTASRRSDPAARSPVPPTSCAAGEDCLRAEARVGYRAPAIAGRVAVGHRRHPGRDRRRLGGRRHRSHRGGPAPAGRHRARHLRLPAPPDGPLRPARRSTRRRCACASRDWFAGRRPTPREVLRRVAPAGRYSGLVLAWSTLRALAARDGVHPLSAPAAGRATRASSARQRPAQASQVCSAAHAAPVRPSVSRSAGSEASRASWRA